MEKLPEGWIKANLFDIAKVYTGRKDANFATENGNFTFFTCALEPLKSDSFSFEGDVLILPGNGANVGEVFYFSGKFEAYQRTYIVDDISIVPKFLFYHFKTYWREKGTSEQYGSATNYIKIGNFKDYIVEFPPLPEQHRIVAKLDALFASLESTKARLAKIPQLMKNFRQAVLTQAVTGKLTESESSWCQKTLGDLVGKGGIFDGPFGSHLKSDDYVPFGVRVVRLENIGHMTFDKSKETFVSQDKYESLVRHTVGEGDIIFSSFISEEIRACILPKLDEKAIAKADCFCIRPNLNVLNSQFLLYSLVSETSYNELILSIHGATRPRINTTQLKQLKINFPPLAEQHEIVRRVERLFAKADAIEQQYQTLKQKIEALPQAILGKAFRGELVEQLPTDGTAEALLKSIGQLNKGLEGKESKHKNQKGYELRDGGVDMVAES
jgi:type I restriction enzyme, S subunit